MNVNIRRTDKEIDYLILDCSDDKNLNELSQLPESSSLYFLNKKTGQTTKIPAQKVKELFTKNYDELKKLLETIILRNKELAQKEILNNLEELVFNDFFNYVKDYRNSFI